MCLWPHRSAISLCLMSKNSYKWWSWWGLFEVAQCFRSWSFWRCVWPLIVIVIWGLGTLSSTCTVFCSVWLGTSQPFHPCCVYSTLRVICQHGEWMLLCLFGLNWSSPRPEGWDGVLCCWSHLPMTHTLWLFLPEQPLPLWEEPWQEHLNPMSLRKKQTSLQLISPFAIITQLQIAVY